MGRSRRLPRGLTASHSRHGEPFGHRPDVVGQPRRHRRAAGSTVAPLVLTRQRPHRPAEVVGIKRQGCDGLTDPPVLRGPVRLAGLPGVAVSVRAVLPLDGRRVDRPADPRQPRCSPCQGSGGFTGDRERPPVRLGPEHQDEEPVTRGLSIPAQPLATPIPRRLPAPSVFAFRGPGGGVPWGRASN